MSALRRTLGAAGWVAWALGSAGVAACAGAPPPAPEAPPAPPPETVAAPEPDAAAAATVEAPPPEPSPAALIEATTKGLAEALEARDPQKAASFFEDDATAVSYGAWDAHGRGAIARQLGGFFAAFDDAKFAVLRGWTKGDVVIQELAWSGTMTGEYEGHAATHAPAGQWMAVVLRFDDKGLIQEMHVYADEAGLIAQARGDKDAPAVPLLPTNEPNVHTATDSPEEDKLVAWARARDEAMEKGDLEALSGGFADDADSWVDFRDKAPTRGRRALRKEVAEWETAFPDQKWTTTGAWGVDGFVVVEHAMSGTQKGPLGDLKASNKRVADWRWLTVLQRDADDKVHHLWAFANLRELERQTGALDAPKRRRAPPKPKAAAPPAPAPAAPAPPAPTPPPPAPPAPRAAPPPPPAPAPPAVAREPPAPRPQSR
jgi:ketosteroid isomerase-like protein